METIGTSMGIVSGGGLGALIGGAGVVAMGTGFGFPAGVALAVVGGAIGNRVGIAIDRPVKSKADEKSL